MRGKAQTGTRQGCDCIADIKGHLWTEGGLAVARLIKPCSMKDSRQKFPRFVPPPIGVVGQNGKAAFPTKTQNGNRWDKTGKQKSGFGKPFTGVHHA